MTGIHLDEMSYTRALVGWLEKLNLFKFLWMALEGDDFGLFILFIYKQ